jgi:hypothetical protein
VEQGTQQGAGQGAPQRRTEGGTGRCVGLGGNKVKLQEWSDETAGQFSRVSLRNSDMAMCSCCREGDCMQRSRTVILHSVAVRDNTSSTKIEMAFTVWGAEQHAHDRVVEVHGCSDDRVDRNIENGESRFFVRGLEPGKGPHCQGRADHACHTSPCARFKRAGEDGTLGMGSRRRRGVLKSGDECSGMFIGILHACADILGGTDAGTRGKEPVCSMPDVQDACCLLSCRVC